MKRKKVRILTRRRLILVLPVVAVLAVGTWFLWFRGADMPNSAESAETEFSELPDTVIKTPEPNPDPNVPGGSTGSSAGENVGPATPSGAFVSNHKPSLSVSGRNQMASACSTTEGAVCVISFTKEGVTKSLEAKQTDKKTGSVTWEWTLQEVGLTAGLWKVKAIATLGGQSKTAEDPLMLEVTP